MWRDILIILAFVFAGLTYFGITPGRLSEYAKTARTEVTKRTPLQRGRLIFAIALSLAFIYMSTGGLVESSLAWYLRLTAAIGMLWTVTIMDFWELREKKGEKVFTRVLIVTSSIFVPLFIVGYALSDMPLLEKVAYPAAAIGVGCISGVVRAYIRRKREDKRFSKETNNSKTNTR
jgi:hypothetical protein